MATLVTSKQIQVVIPPMALQTTILFFYEESVGWEDRGICCDTCNIWYHIDCHGMSKTMFSIINKSSGEGIVRECIKCGMPNFYTT